MNRSYGVGQVGGGGSTCLGVTLFSFQSGDRCDTDQFLPATCGGLGGARRVKIGVSRAGGLVGKKE